MKKEVYSINDIDNDDGFDFTSSTNKRNEVVLLTNDHIENIEQISFDNDMLLQGRSNIVGSIIKPIPNIKEEGKMSYPCRVYVVSTKANIWIAFSMLYRDIDKCPYSDSFWMSKVMRSPKEEEMKKYFKFHLICNLRSKESSLVAKSSGRANNNYQKCIIRLQKVNFKPKYDENVRLISEWGRNMAYFIDKLVLEVY